MVLQILLDVQQYDHFWNRGSFFLGLHFYDFWIPEMNYKYVEVLPENPTRYYEETVHKFENPVRVGLYVLSLDF